VTRRRTVEVASEGPAAPTRLRSYRGRPMRAVRTLLGAAAIAGAAASSGGCGKESIAPGAARAPFAVAPLGPLSVERRAELERDVASLASLKDPTPGLDDGWAGTPAEGPPAMERLVRAGPEAIPILLAHLEDAAATKLRFERGVNVGMGTIWAASAIPYDPQDPEDVAAVKTVSPPLARLPLHWATSYDSPVDERRLDDYTVTIGDACYVTLGRISARPYAATSGVPTMNIGVSSPTRDPRLARVVRAMWLHGDARQALAARLVRTLDAQDGLREQAADRLVAYYPQEAESFLLGRVESGTFDVLPALAPLDDPRVRAAVRRALRTATDSEIVLHTAERMHGTEEAALALRLRALFRHSTSALRADPSTHALLLATADAFPGAAPQVFIDYASSAGARGAPDLERWRDVLSLVDALAPGRRSPFLRALLGIDGVFWADPASAGAPAGKPLRVSDRAALRVAALRTDLPFDPAAWQRDRDARIAKMIRALDAESP
jgi:hypothetical protein